MHFEILILLILKDVVEIFQHFSNYVMTLGSCVFLAHDAHI